MFIFLLNLLNKLKYFPYFVVTTTVYSYGDTCEQIDIANRIAYKKNKKLILLHFFIFQKFLKYNICNLSLFNDLVFFKKLSFLDVFFRYIFQILVNIDFIFIRSFVLLADKISIRVPEFIRFPLIGVGKYIFCDKSFFSKKFNSIKGFPSYLPTIKIKKNLELKCKKILLDKIGNKKFVCLHVRDGVFYKDHKRRPFRNSDVNNYIPAIKFLIKKGYVIVRLGNKSANQLNFSHKNFFHYNQSSINSKLMDLFLVKNCEFFIGNHSGPLDLSFMFNKPTLITNAVSLVHGIAKNKKSLMLLKKVFFKKKKLDICEFIKLPVDQFNHLTKNNYLTYKQNTKRQLFLVVKEFQDLINSKKNFASHNRNNFNYLIIKELQKKFLLDETARVPIFKLILQWNKSKGRGFISKLSFN